MKFFIDLSIKFLKRQKRRTVLSFISISLAAFITGISFFTLNSLYYSIKNIIVSFSGSAEVTLQMLSDYDKNNIIKIMNHNLTEDFYLRSQYEIYDENGTAKLFINDDHIMQSSSFIFYSSYGDMTPFLNIKNSDGYYTQNHKYKYQNGIIIPEKYLQRSYHGYKFKHQNGIILSDAYLQQGYKINDTIILKIDLGTDTERKDSICEEFVIEDFADTKTQNVFYVASDQFLHDYSKANKNVLISGNNNYALLNVKKGNYKKNLNTILKDCGINSNYDLLEKNNCINKELLMFKLKKIDCSNNIIRYIAIIIIFLIISWIIARFIIENAFEISSIERTRKFNTMKIVGASDEQLSVLILIEGILYSISAIPTGLITAYFVLRSIIISFQKENILGLIIFKPGKLTFAAVYILCSAAIIISSHTSGMRHMKNKTPTEVSCFGNVIKRKHRFKHEKFTADRTTKDFVKLYSRRNIMRTKKNYILSVFSCSACIFTLTASVLYGFSVKNVYSYEHDSDYDCNYEFFYSGTESKEKLNKIFSNVKKNCSISYYPYTFLVSPGFKDQYEIKTDITREDENILKKFNVPGTIYLVSADRKNYETFIQPAAGIDYDDLILNKYAIICTKDKNSSGTEYTSYMDYGFDFPPCIIEDRFNLKIAGTFTSDKYDTCIIIPVETAESLGLTNYNIRINETNKYANQTVYNEIISLEKSVPDLNLKYSERFYNYEINNKIKESTKKAITTILVFLWLTNIVSIINTTLTRLYNSQTDYFILRCCGMTVKDLVHSVIREIKLFSSVSVVSGFILGYAVIYIYKLIPSEYFSVQIYPGMPHLIPWLFIILAANVIIPILFSLPTIKVLLKTSNDINNYNYYNLK